MERTLDRERERAQQRRSERQRPRPEAEYTTEGIAQTRKNKMEREGAREQNAATTGHSGM